MPELSRMVQAFVLQLYRENVKNDERINILFWKGKAIHHIMLSLSVVVREVCPNQADLERLYCDWFPYKL